MAAGKRHANPAGSLGLSAPESGFSGADVRNVKNNGLTDAGMRRSSALLMPCYIGSYFFESG